MATVLIVYGTSHGQTARIAEHIRQQLAARGIAAEAHDVRSLPKGLAISSYDGFIVGGRVWGVHFQKKLRRFVIENRARLQPKPNAFYSVCLGVLQKDPEVQKEVAEMIPRFVSETGWRPKMTAVFAGALKYTKYNFFIRWAMKRIVRKAGGDTDTSRDYEYTDWNAVAAFTQKFADALTSSAAVREVDPALRRDPGIGVSAPTGASPHP